MSLCCLNPVMIPLTEEQLGYLQVILARAPELGLPPRWIRELEDVVEISTWAHLPHPDEA
jgi:hypothetical protein